MLKSYQHSTRIEFLFSICHEVLKMSRVKFFLLLKLFSLRALFSHCSFSQCKGWQSKVTFEKCISLSAPSICSFSLQTAPSICTQSRRAQIRSTHTHAHTQTYLHPAPLTMMSQDTTELCFFCLFVSFGPLNDTLAGCGVTCGPIRSQTQHQICHIRSCDDLLDITLPPPDDRLSTPASR